MVEDPYKKVRRIIPPPDFVIGKRILRSGSSSNGRASVHQTERYRFDLCLPLQELEL